MEMKAVLFGAILHQFLSVVNAVPGFGGCWGSSGIAFAAGAGVMDAPSPPPVSDTEVLQDSPSPEPAPPGPPPPTEAPDTFSTSTDRCLTIFYDAMDESSQIFFNSTLVNQYDQISSNVNITFIPCQNAKDSDGELKCSSQGDPTCTLNKMQSCAIAQITDKKKLINYFACTMKTVDKLPDYSTCASQNGVNDASISSCAAINTGYDLCKAYAAKKMSDMNTLPGFIFKKPEDIKTTDAFGHLDYYRNQICKYDLSTAVNSQLIVSNAPSPPSQCTKELVLGIFYKVMDDKSQKWFHTLSSIYDKFNKYISFKYQPCMFAEVSDDGTLDCKDEKDKDCVGGKTHACAITLIKEQETLFKFLNCTMQGVDNSPNFEKCATDNQVQYDPIKTCANSDKGKNLCQELSKTRPNSDHIPMFSYELTFDEDTSKATSAATDLRNSFCEQLKKYKITTPQDCNSNNSTK